jgi:hypothetical protein
MAMRAFGDTYAIPGVYRRPSPRAEGFPRVRTDVAGFVGVAGPLHLGEAVAVDDWKSWVAKFRRDANGAAVEAPLGGMLESAVRDFFANGGRRVWIVNVAEQVDDLPAQVLLNRMLGLEAIEPQGLELLLRQDEVSIVALPDLDALQEVIEDISAPDPPGDPCFGPCVVIGGPAPQQARTARSLGRIFSDDDLAWAQRYLIQRLLRVRWRWFGIVAPPPGLNAEQAVAWRDRIAPRPASEPQDDDPSYPDPAAIYWPWLLMQDSPGAEVVERSPLGAVAGIFAQVDLESGPQTAPANRQVVGAVGLQSPVEDEENALAYEAGVNVLREWPGQGVQLWGARTLRWFYRESRGAALSFINARRCLSAICRSAEVVGQPLVFQPNGVLVRIKLHQLMTDYLLRVFASGALMGDQPEQGFFVAVDTVENSPEGELVCRIGVALAAPAEFIEFRIGRQDGVIEQAAAG